MDDLTREPKRQPEPDSSPVERSLFGVWVVGLLTPILSLVMWTLAHTFASYHGAPRGDTVFAWMPMFTWAISILVLIVNLIVLVLFTLFGKSAFGPFLNGLLVTTNMVMLALVFGGFGVLSMPDGFPMNVPVLLALLGGALVATIPMLVWWLSNHVANPGRRRAIVWSGAAIVVIAVGVMSLLQVDAPPSYPSLSAEPDSSIPGTVAYIHHATGQGECLYTVAASGGEPRRVTCKDGRVKGLAWVSDGRILLRWKVDGQHLYVQVDADTGKEVSSVPAADLSKADRRRTNDVLDSWYGKKKRADGAVLRMPNYRVIVRFPEGEKQTILKLDDDVSSTYSFFDMQWAPDGEWVLLSDSEGRLLIVAADGDPSARILAGKGSGYTAAWHIPGNPTYTVNKADVPR